MRAYFSCSFLPARFGFKVCTTCPSSLATPECLVKLKNFCRKENIPRSWRGSQDKREISNGGQAITHFWTEYSSVGMDQQVSRPRSSLDSRSNQSRFRSRLNAHLVLSFSPIRMSRFTIASVSRGGNLCPHLSMKKFARDSYPHCVG